MSLVTIRLDAQFGTPYPRSAGFDTDIGAFIESSSVSSPIVPMAPSIINNNAVQGETFLPGQIFVFGGFAVRANSLGHLEQIESYAPSHQVRFGSLNYVVDLTVRGVAFDLLQTAKRVGPQCEAAEYEDLSGEKSLTLDRVVVEAIGPKGDDTEELSMKAPMSVSKPADLG